MEEVPSNNELTKRIKELENTLREKEKEYNQLKRTFLSHINHEIRTPMNSIIGFSSLLADRNITQEQKELYLNYINNSSESLLGIIENMIDMSLLEAGQVQLNESAFSVSELFEELYFRLTKIKHKRDRTSVAILLSQPRLPEELIIVADRYRLEQIMINLSENAMKFTDKGVIEFGYSIRNEQILQLFVKDTGRGIDLADQHLIFESFRKAPETNMPSISGGGLGLSIVKELVKLMQGDVWVEPNEDQGSVFKINLPLKKAGIASVYRKKSPPRSFLEDLRQGSRHLAI